MYTTDYIRLEKKARENNLLDDDRFMFMQIDAMDELQEEFSVNFVCDGEGKIIGAENRVSLAEGEPVQTIGYVIDTHKANLRHAEILETLINDCIYNNWIKRVYGSIACYNSDPFVCEETTIVEDVATTIYECGLRHVEDMAAFCDALKKLGIDDEEKYEVSAVYETPNKELTICLNEDFTLL